MTDRRIESIKNVFLVVLFSTTILLLYLLWSHNSNNFSILNILAGSGEKADVPRLEEVMAPRYVAISDGSGVFRLAEGYTAHVAAAASEALTEACGQGSVAVSEINRMQYSAVMSRYNSIQTALCCDIPFSDYAAYNGVSIGAPADQIQTVSLIAFSDASKESIFIYDGPQDRYFRLRTSADHEYTAQLASMCTAGSASCYPASEILGFGRAYIAVGVESSLSEGSFISEAAERGRDLRTSMAETVMGENFDFVRRISDGFGNTTYMYGYGQKTFTARADGSFEYSSELSSGSAGDFYSDLKTAVTFVARCGGWPGLGGEQISLVLDRADSFGEGRQAGHTFRFKQLLGGVPVRGEDEYPVEITVTNGQVSYYRRAVINYLEMTWSGSSQTAEPVNVIANNCNHIYNVMHNNTLVAAVDEAFSEVSEALVDMHQGYFQSSQGSALVPCWIVRMNDGSDFFFDLYDAAPLGFRRSGEYGLE